MAEAGERESKKRNAKKNKLERCLLCGEVSFFFALYRDIEYCRCGNCQAIFMAPRFLPSPEREKKRYEKHNNDINDPRYQEFVSPVVNEVTKNFGSDSRGLDFGAGTGPVAANLLEKKGYKLELYDPFFRNDGSVLKKKYDYIICSEVIEHFHKPAREFGLMRSLLNPGGSLICMTTIYREYIDFLTWRYKDDETHVIFYHTGSLKWIKNNFSFASLDICDNLIHFKI